MVNFLLQYRLPLIAIVLITVGVYLPVFGFDFVNFDDPQLVYENPFIQNFSLKIFTTYDPELYIPLTLLSYQVEHAIFGLNPAAFHLTNVLLHIANAVMVFMVLLKLKRNSSSYLLPFIGALLFAVHPLHTEAVVWVSARKDLLSGFFFLLSLLLYMHKRRLIFWSIGAFVLALLSKVTAITLIPVLLLVDWRDTKRFTVRSVIEKWPYIFLGIVFAIIAYIGKTSNLTAFSAVEFALLACKSIAFYVQKLFVPSDLYVLYLWKGFIYLLSPSIALTVLLCIAIGITLWISYRRSSDVLFGLAFFCITLAPSLLTFSKAGHIYFASDRYAYIPSIGIIFLLVLLLSRCVNSRRCQIITAVSGLCVVSVFAVMARAQSAIWHDSPTLYQHVLAHDPESYIALNNLGVLMLENHQYEDALWHLERAASVKEDYTSAMLNMGVAHYYLGNLEEAEEVTARVTVLRPSMLKGWFSLGWIYEQEGKYEEALQAFATALEIDDTDPQVHWHIGHVYGKQGKYKAGLDAYRKAMALDPAYEKQLETVDALMVPGS
ncbi:MAG: tetratricopeptide repeat protein [bacterium]|nr:tetratricopeptide repeat protein [bacterium]